MDVEWVTSSIPGMGHYVFVIETKMKDSVDLVQVKRRYTEFDQLYKLL